MQLTGSSDLDFECFPEPFSSSFFTPERALVDFDVYLQCITLTLPALNWSLGLPYSYDEVVLHSLSFVLKGNC